jgi:uncharacterized membrane protein
MLLFAALLIYAVVSRPHPLSAAGPFFQGLGQLDPNPIVQNAGTRGISPDGRIIVGSAGSGPGIEAYRWSLETGMVGLGDLAGGVFQSSAQGVTADGRTVVGYSGSDIGEQAFRWTAEDGMVGLGDSPDRPNLSQVQSQARDITPDGLIIVGAGTSAFGTRQAVRWTTSGIEGLGYLDGDTEHFSEASAVSSDGNVVVGRARSPSDDIVPFRWTVAEGMMPIGDLPGGFVGGTADDVCGNEAIVGVGNSANGTEAYRWTAEGGMIGLGDLPGGDFGSHAYGCSDDGRVVVGLGNGPSGNEPFIWDPIHGMRNLSQVLTQEYGLDLTGWDLREARVVSADGRVIAGTGTHITRGENWVAVLIPEPTTWALVSGVLLILVGRHVSQRRSHRFMTKAETR